MRSGTLLALILGLLALALAALLLNDGGSIAGLPEDRFAALAYYGAWGLALSAGLVLMTRTRLGEALKGLGIWALAFLVLIGAYSFAPELGALKNRIMAVLIPGMPVPLEGAEGNRFMALRGMDGHFHLDGRINGYPVSFIVDTGASMIAMDRSSARSIGIDPDSLTYSTPLVTANGVARAASIRLDRVTIGGIERRNVPAAVTEGDGLGVVLLGMSFLGTLTSFDFRRDRLILTD